MNALITLCAIFSTCRNHNRDSCIPTEHPTLAASGSIPVLVFNGTGTSPCDVVAIETILDSNHISYSTVNSQQLNSTSVLQLREYQLLIIPGGNFVDMGKSLTVRTAANIRNAVGNGLNYLGICAGGFLAGNSGYYNGFNLTSNIRFGFYSDANKRQSKAAVAIALAGGKTQEHYWENGPQFSGWGAVIGKYPDGTTAIVEGACGKGWLILTGIHAEAPEYWRNNMSFTTPAITDNAYALTLVQAALNHTLLPHY